MQLKEMRIKCGYSQAELAELSGINFRSLQDYEQGHKPISSAKGETLYRLSHVLGYSIEDILNDSCNGIELWNSDTNSSVQSGRILAYEKAMQRRRDAQIHFPVIAEDDVIDMSRIYPTKQRVIKDMVEQLRGDIRLKSLVLFGSSITIRCNKDSDIDLAIGLKECTEKVKNEISERVQLACDWGADILWMDRLSSEDRVYQDIMKGLTLI